MLVLAVLLMLRKIPLECIWFWTIKKVENWCDDNKKTYYYSCTCTCTMYNYSRPTAVCLLNCGHTENHNSFSRRQNARMALKWLENQSFVNHWRSHMCFKKLLTTRYLNILQWLNFCFLLPWIYLQMITKGKVTLRPHVEENSTSVQLGVDSFLLQGYPPQQ